MTQGLKIFRAMQSLAAARDMLEEVGTETDDKTKREELFDLSDELTGYLANLELTYGVVKPPKDAA